MKENQYLSFSMVTFLVGIVLLVPQSVLGSESKPSFVKNPPLEEPHLADELEYANEPALGADHAYFADDYSATNLSTFWTLFSCSLVQPSSAADCIESPPPGWAWAAPFAPILAPGGWWQETYSTIGAGDGSPWASMALCVPCGEDQDDDDDDDGNGGDDGGGGDDGDDDNPPVLPPNSF